MHSFGKETQGKAAQSSAHQVFPFQQMRAPLVLDHLCPLMTPPRWDSMGIHLFCQKV